MAGILLFALVQSEQFGFRGTLVAVFFVVLGLANDARTYPVCLFAASLAADAFCFSVFDKPRTIAVLGLSLLFAHGVKCQTFRTASLDSTGISTDQFIILFVAVLSLKALTIE